MTDVSKALATVAALILVFSSSEPAADTAMVTPKGEYARIDVSLTDKTTGLLTEGTPEERQRVIEGIQAHPENYAPPVLYVLSDVLFQEGKKDEGAFWFYAGQLRARFDANRCADASARQAVGLLNRKYGAQINQYTRQDIAGLEELIPKVVEWDRKTAHHYDHRWINLHGMGAVTSGLETNPSGKAKATLSLPKEQWNAIAEKTRVDYLSNFKKAMARMRNGNH